MDTLVGSKIKIHNYTPNPEINNQEGIIINKSGFDKYTIRLSNGVGLSLKSKYMIFLPSPESPTNHIANTSGIEESKETSEPIDIKCPNCLVKNSKEGHFCYKCGYSLGVSKECCVCLEKTSKLTPCGHPLCNACSEKLQKNECPVCKKSMYTQTYYVNLLSTYSVKICMWGITSYFSKVSLSIIDKILFRSIIKNHTSIFKYWNKLNLCFLSFCLRTIFDFTSGLVIGMEAFQSSKFKRDGNFYLAFNGKITKI